MFFFYANQKGDDKNEMIDDVSKNAVNCRNDSQTVSDSIMHISKEVATEGLFPSLLFSCWIIRTSY
ncbi:hypothetical protein BSM4216_3391 [Bacillus smithii]|nr:hypothetical protein BSM4216_3391 [Bacillus smithii]